MEDGAMYRFKIDDGFSADGKVTRGWGQPDVRVVEKAQQKLRRRGGSGATCRAGLSEPIEVSCRDAGTDTG